MFFTRVGYVVAWLAFVAGAFSIIMGIGLAINDDAALTARYLGRKNTGQSIDRGTYTLIFGIALGVLCEIGKHIAARPDGTTG